MITALLDVVDEHSLHGIAADTEGVLLVGLATVRAERVAKLITCGSGKFTRLVRRRIVVETSRRLIEGSAHSSFAGSIELGLSIISHVLVEVLALREAGGLGERKKLLRRRSVDGGQV